MQNIVLRPYNIALLTKLPCPTLWATSKNSFTGAEHSVPSEMVHKNNNYYTFMEVAGRLHGENFEAIVLSKQDKFCHQVKAVTADNFDDHDIKGDICQ